MNARFWAIGAVAAAIAVSSCENITLQEESGIKTITELTAVSGEDLPDTKTVINLNDGYDIRWTSGDAINVFFGASEGSRFVTQTSGDIAQFKGSIDVVTGGGEGLNDDTSLWGVYPYSSKTTCDGSSITYTLPSVQEAKAGSFAEDLFPQIARSKNFYMTFYNLCGSFRFRLSNPDIVKVTLRGNNDEPIAGRAKISMDGAPAVSEILEGSEELVMYAPDGECFETDEWYLFVLYPTAFENGLTITFHKEDSQASYVYSKSYTLNRNKFSYFDKSDAGLTFEKVEDEDDQGNIVFADAVMKEMCVNAFDTNDDGELSFSEAAAVTSLDAMSITDKTIKSFDEFQYFTGVSYIPQEYFAGTEIQSIIIPKSVELIGVSAFSNCTRLNKIEIPEKVSAIWSNVFENCSALTNIKIPDSVTIISEFAFSGCSSLTEITIPEDVTTIGDCAFKGCMSLSSISIPESVTTIGVGAFENCSALTSIKIPNSITSIGFGAFGNCLALKEVSLSNSLTEISFSAFAGSGLTSIVIPEGVTTIGDCAFNGCMSLSSISIPESVTTIGVAAFENCSMTSISIPEGVTTIEGATFNNCLFLKTVSIPNTVTTIGYDAFRNCALLNNISIPASVKTIGDNAFYLCRNLTTISLPESVICIGKEAFSFCELLETVTVSSMAPPECGSSVFSNNASGTKILVPSASVDAYKSADGWSEYADYIVGVDCGNIVFSDPTMKAMCINAFDTDMDKELSYVEAAVVRDLSKMIITDKTIKSFDEFQYFTGVEIIPVDYFSSTEIQSIILPESISIIGEYCFSDCSNLTDIELPEHVVRVGDHAFAYCPGLSAITIPDSVVKIGDLTFAGCSSLTEITVPDSVTSIGEQCFCNCSSLKEISLSNSLTSIGDLTFANCSSLTGLRIPDSVTHIGDRAFENCTSLKEISLSNSLTSISWRLFFGCSSLVSISIPESVTIISDCAFWECDSLESVIMNNVTPPECGSSVFSNNASGMKILVPSASVDAYKSADGWSEYANYIEGVD